MPKKAKVSLDCQKNIAPKKMDENPATAANWVVVNFRSDAAATVKIIPKTYNKPFFMVKVYHINMGTDNVFC